jgi:hypothetical protein
MLQMSKATPIAGIAIMDNFFEIISFPFGV